MGRTGQVDACPAGPDACGSEFGSGGPSVSADGRLVAFTSDTSGLVPSDSEDRNDVYVRDRRAGTLTRVSVRSDGAPAEFNAASFAPSISADGRFVAFTSNAEMLVPDDTNGVEDVFVRRRR